MHCLQINVKQNNSAAFFVRRVIQIAACACALIVFLLAIAAFAVPFLAAIIQNSAEKKVATDYVHLCAIAGFTLKQAIFSTAIAVLVGLPAAFFISHRDFPFRRILSACAAVPLCIPSLIIALGYVSFFGMNGILNRVLASFFSTDKKIISFLYSFWGIVIAQGFYNFPLVMATVADSWATLPRAQEDAATVLGASNLRIFFTITVWHLLPAIISACIPVFLYCFFSFLIVLLFGGIGTTTLEVELYQAARNSLDLSAATKIALIETTLAMAIVVLYSAAENTSGTQKNAEENPVRRHKIRGAEILIAGFFFLAIALFFVLPLLCIVFSAFPHGSLAVFQNVIHKKGFLPALLSSAKIGVCTAVLCIIAAFSYAVFLKSHRNNLVLKTLPILPMALSSVVMGFGMTRTVRAGSPLILVAAQTALMWPLAFRQIWAGFAKIPSETLDAARLLSPHKIDAIFGVFLGECKRNILSAAVLCFAVSAGDTTLPLVLAIPHFDTLSLFTYRLAGSYRFGEASAAALVLGAWCMTLFAIANKMKENDDVF